MIIVIVGILILVFGMIKVLQEIQVNHEAATAIIERLDLIEERLNSLQLEAIQTSLSNTEGCVSALRVHVSGISKVVKELHQGQVK